MTEKNYQLLMQKGPTPGQTYPIGAILITLGRDPLADIVVSDPEVSRQHARLMETEAGYELQDLGSTNGTFIDGRRLGGEAELLQSGQKVEMGSGVVFLFQEVPVTGNIEPTFIHDQLPPSIPNELDGTLANSPSYETPTPLEENANHIDWVETPSPPPQEEPRPIPSPYAPPPPEMPAPNSNTSRRTTAIRIMGILFILLLSCCAFTLFMWFIGGDWLLTQFGVLP